MRRRISASCCCRALLPQCAFAQGADSDCCSVLLEVAAAGRDSELRRVLFAGCCCRVLLQGAVEGTDAGRVSELRRRPRLQVAQGAGCCCWVPLQSAVAGSCRRPSLRDAQGAPAGCCWRALLQVASARQVSELQGASSECCFRVLLQAETQPSLSELVSLFFVG